MEKNRSLATARHHLDGRFAKIAPLKATMSRPPKGWIKAIRQALGMPEQQLARRLGVRQPTVVDIERSEVRGGIKLNTLQRAAEALNCTLVYALVPNEPLETTVRERIRKVADRHLQSVEQTMRLENQAVTDQSSRENELEMLALKISRRALWDDK